MLSLNSDLKSADLKYGILVDRGAKYDDVIKACTTLETNVRHDNLKNKTKYNVVLITINDLIDEDNRDRISLVLDKVDQFVVINPIDASYYTTYSGDLSKEMQDLILFVQKEYSSKAIFYLNHVNGASNNNNYSIKINNSDRRYHAEILPTTGKSKPFGIIEQEKSTFRRAF